MGTVEVIIVIRYDRPYERIYGLGSACIIPQSDHVVARGNIRFLFIGNRKYRIRWSQCCTTIAYVGVPIGLALEDLD